MIGGPRHNGRKVGGWGGVGGTHFSREQSANNVFVGLWVKGMHDGQKRKESLNTEQALLIGLLGTNG